MIIHPRSEWEDPARPVNATYSSGPTPPKGTLISKGTGPKFPWNTLNGVVIHYTAAPNLPDGDSGEPWSLIPGYLRSIHRDYSSSRGYSIGYNFAIDGRGEVWELRGWDIKPAATLGHNDHLVAFLMLTDGQDPATPAQIASAKILRAEATARAKKTLTLGGHRDYAATQCPGNGIYAQIKAGLFNLDVAPLPSIPPVTLPPEVPPVTLPPITLPPYSPEEEEMKPIVVRFKGYWNEFLLTSGGYIHGTEVLAAAWRTTYGAAVVLDAHPVGMKCALAQCGLSLTDLTPSDGS